MTAQGRKALRAMTEVEKDLIALGVLQVVAEVGRMVGAPGRRVLRNAPEPTGIVVDPKFARFVYERNAR